MCAIPVFLLAFAGCSQDTLEEINENKNNPSEVAGKLIITDAIASSAFTMTSSDMAFYASIYIEQNAGIWGQMNAAEIRSGEATSATTYNNQWNAGYSNLYNLKTVIEKTSEGGSEEGHFHLLGMAQVLSAYNWAILTDAFGDIPFTEALLPGEVFQPKLDKQEVIYDEIFRLLDAAIANFAKTSTYPALGAQDLLYKGNVTKWAKFAQGLKARYTTRLALKRPGKWNDVITFANASFASKAEEAAFQYNGSTSISPFYKFLEDRNYMGASQSFNNKLTAANDPRKEVFWVANPDADGLEFAEAGTTDADQSVYGISALSNATAPTFMLSYHEVLFLKAEAYARLNQPTQAWAELEKAVKTAFVKVGLTETDATTYLTGQVKARFDANSIKEIMFQKYVAFFEEEALEAYNDVRRIKAENNGVNAITLEHPTPSLFPWRFTYGADDVTTNLNVLDAYGDGTYVYSEKVWWAGGTR